MLQDRDQFRRSYANAIGRWAGIGPYYAMFPLEFAFEVVNRYSKPGDSVLDPFAGRASSVYAAATQGRLGLGIEINPVGWVYGQAKLNTAHKEDVGKRLKFIAWQARYFGKRSRDKLPEFFHLCYSKKVLSFLLAARTRLNWQENNIDATLMALLMVHLHAKLGSGLSNQMRQSKAMAPDYSVRWWKEREMEPPDIDPYEFMLQRIQWRYAKGRPDVTASEVMLGDSVDLLDQVVEQVENGTRAPYTLLLTSPPYHDVTHYHYDQWLRLWLLGGPDQPSKTEGPHKGRFSSKENYRYLLQTVFEKASQMMAENGVIYVRTDARKFTFDTTKDILKKCFSEWEQTTVFRPVNGTTQTTLYGDKSEKPGEVDIILKAN